MSSVCIAFVQAAGKVACKSRMCLLFQASPTNPPPIHVEFSKLIGSRLHEAVLSPGAEFQWRGVSLILWWAEWKEVRKEGRQGSEGGRRLEGRPGRGGEWV